MTLQNLKYVITIAEHQSFSAAAKALFISQSTLSSAVKELEGEMGIRLFFRSNRGVSLTGDGEDFIRHAREIVEQAGHLEHRYEYRKYAPTRFAVSTQRLPFAVRAFNRFIAEIEWNIYDVAIRECPTYTIISDVATGKSDLGVLAIHDRYLPSLVKNFSLNEVCFHEIARLRAYAFLRKGHPLARQSSVSMEQLLAYPFVTYDQEADRSEYTEEIVYHQMSEKTIHVCDRCTKIAIVRFTDAFSIGTDLTNSNADTFHSGMGEVVALPVEELSDSMHIGYLVQKNDAASETADQYLAVLREDIEKISSH